MKVWKNKQKEIKELKKPMVVLRDRLLVAVDPDTGDSVSVLFNFNRMSSPELAKDALANCGYITNWAIWDDLGRMTQLLEDFEGN